MIALATISRWAMPPDRAITGASARSARRTLTSISSVAAFDSLPLIPKNRPWKYRFSDTVIARSSVLVCGTTPITCLASAGLRMMSTPPTSADPLVGVTRVVSMPMVVDLPAPLGPRKP